MLNHDDADRMKHGEASPSGFKDFRKRKSARDDPEAVSDGSGIGMALGSSTHETTIFMHNELSKRVKLGMDEAKAIEAGDMEGNRRKSLLGFESDRQQMQTAGKLTYFRNDIGI
jgi:hypothetical protein